MPQLHANRHRLDSAHRHEYERGRAVHYRDAFVIDGCEPSQNSAAFEVARLMDRYRFRLGSHTNAPYLRLSRYATSASIFDPGNNNAGMFAPGLISPGCAIHLATLSGVFFRTPAARVVRLPKWVRSGPMYPFDTPWIMWQLVHGLLAKIFAPAAATRSLCGGLTGFASWALSHAAKFSGESTKTRKRMFACERPQNSANGPRYSPVVFEIYV